MQQLHVHRRKSSTEEDENLIILPNNPPDLQSNAPFKPVPPSNRVNSSPAQRPLSLSLYPNAPPSAGPYKPNFALNGLPSSPFRSNFGHNRTHSRTGSISGSLAPPSPSPLSGAFPSNISHSHSDNRTLNPNNNEFIVPSTPNPSDLSNGTTPSLKPNSLRHTRLHSRNLSVFFPHPGSLPESSISEDGAQEIQLAVEAPVVDMPSASPGFIADAAPYSAHKAKLQGFTFGGKPSTGPSAPSSAPASGTSRRGHHHKHSMSHNFFSFLEPGSQTDSSDLHTQPTPVPVSPWNPISPFPESAVPTKTTFGRQNIHSHEHEDDYIAHTVTTLHHEPSGGLQTKPLAVTATLGQFLLGAWLWVSGQQIGSLSCTGLGYWVVFDSFGIALNTLLPAYLAKESMQNKLRRSYG